MSPDSPFFCSDDAQNVPELAAGGDHLVDLVGPQAASIEVVADLDAATPGSGERNEAIGRVHGT
jgi:hypothetical protein